MKRKKIITVALITLVAICLITTGISAANLIGADSVQYKDTTVKAALDDLIDKVNVNICNDGALCSKVKLGDYVSMTPTSTSYNISKDLTGYSSDQTINPSELNLWRVIAINEDGTIDMVSEYVSSTDVYFSGQKGYLNLVGALNTIAKQYERINCTVGSRHMGYNGQTEHLPPTIEFTTTAPWSSSTTDNSNEEVGGGDTLYEKDYNLVKNVLGTLAAKRAGTGTSYYGWYWIASRNYQYYNKGRFYWNARLWTTTIGLSSSELVYYYGGDRATSDSENAGIRPIVTLKAGLLALGSGTSDDPWVI